MILAGGHAGRAGVPVEAGNVAGAGGQVLETVLVRSRLVTTLILSELQKILVRLLQQQVSSSYLYLPLSSGGGGASVNVNVDHVALVRGGDKHVLASVISTDDGRCPAPRVGDGHGVCPAVCGPGTICGCIGAGQTIGSCQHHHIKVKPKNDEHRIISLSHPSLIFT